MKRGMASCTDQPQPKPQLMQLEGGKRGEGLQQMPTPYVLWSLE